MTRNLSQPFHARILHADIGIQSLRNGVIDERRPLFLEQVNLSLFLFDERVNLCSLAVEEVRDGLLFGRGILRI